MSPTTGALIRIGAEGSPDVNSLEHAGYHSTVVGDPSRWWIGGSKRRMASSSGRASLSSGDPRDRLPREADAERGAIECIGKQQVLISEESYLLVCTVEQVLCHVRCLPICLLEQPVGLSFASGGVLLRLRAALLGVGLDLIANRRHGRREQCQQGGDLVGNARQRLRGLKPVEFRLEHGPRRIETHNAGVDG